MKKKIGIWLDFKEANIISVSGKNEFYETIVSEIDTSRPKGGSRSAVPYGATEKISEKAYLERRKREEKLYFEKIIETVNEADEMYLFGPAEAKDGLVKAIKNSKDFHPHLLGVETADSMTKNQKVAQVRDFYQKAL